MDRNNPAVHESHLTGAAPPCNGEKRRKPPSVMFLEALLQIWHKTVPGIDNHPKTPENARFLILNASFSRGIFLDPYKRRHDDPPAP
jgi:hypothetical protein